MTTPQGIRETDIRDAITYIRASLAGDRVAAGVIMQHADPLRTWIATASILSGNLLNRFGDDREQIDRFLESLLTDPDRTVR